MSSKQQDLPPQSEDVSQKQVEPKTAKRPAKKWTNKFKRPRLSDDNANNANNHDANGKRTDAKFQRKNDVAVLSTYVLLPVFEIFTSTFGVRHVCNQFYDIMHSRDSKLTSLITLPEFTYVVLLSVINRCVTVTNKFKTSIIYNTSVLKETTKDILLPDCIATFVEIFGRVELSSGISVIPHFRSYPEMRLIPGFYDPLMLLEEMDLVPTHPDWAVNNLPVLKWIHASTRVLKNAMELRTVRFEEIEGRPELLASFERYDNELMQVYAIDKIDQNQAQLGACMRFRQLSYMDKGIGLPLPVIYGAPSVDPQIKLSTHLRNSLRQEPRAK